MILGQGYLGVALFFVISGFCIHYPQAREGCDRLQAQPDFWVFWKRRLRRLYPPYFVALCISMSLVVIAYLAKAKVPLLELYPSPKGQWIALDFFAHATMLHGLHPLLDGMAGNPPFWSLAREEYLYLLYFPLLFSQRHWGRYATFLGIVVVGLAFQVAMIPWIGLSQGWSSIVATSAIALWIQWHLGVISVEFYCGLVSIPRWCRLGWLTPVWFFAGKLSERYFPLLSPILWGMTFFTLLNYCVSREKAGRWLQHPVASWLTRMGIYSYSVYLIHIPVRTVIKYALHLNQRPSNALAWVVLTCGITAAGVAAGKLLFLLVERRFLNSSSVLARSMPVMQSKPATAD